MQISSSEVSKEATTERARTDREGGADGSPPLSRMVVREGWASKQSRFLGQWRQRWLVLEDDGAGLPTLSTFKAPPLAADLSAPTEVIALANARVERVDLPADQAPDGPDCAAFAVVGDRAFSFCCGGDSPEAAAEAADGWVDSLCEAIDSASRRARWEAAREALLRKWMRIAEQEEAAGQLPVVDGEREASAPDVELILLDVERCQPATLPVHPVAAEEHKAAVRCVLCAWCAHGGVYSQALAFVASAAVSMAGGPPRAGVFPRDAQRLFSLLLARAPTDFAAEVGALSSLLADRVPSIFGAEACRRVASEALPLLALKWMLPVWVDVLPPAALLAAWDVMVSEPYVAEADGPPAAHDARGEGGGRAALGSASLRVATAILTLAEPRICAAVGELPESIADPALVYALVHNAVQEEPPDADALADAVRAVRLTAAEAAQLRRRAASR